MLIARRSVLIGLGLVGFGPAFAEAALEIVQAGTVESVTGESTGRPVSYTHLTLPTNREV